MTTIVLMTLLTIYDSGPTYPWGPNYFGVPNWWQRYGVKMPQFYLPPPRAHLGFNDLHAPYQLPPTVTELRATTHRKPMPWDRYPVVQSGRGWAEYEVTVETAGRRIGEKITVIGPLNPWPSRVIGR